MAVEKSRDALDLRDPVLADVVVDQLPLGFDDRTLAEHEVRDGDILLDVIVDAIQPALAKTREIQGGLAERLGRNPPGVDRRAARLRRALHDTHALAEVGGLRGALFAGGSGADHDEVVVFAH